MDIEDGGRGGGNDDDAAVISSVPNQADPQRKELQPCTWLRAAPIVVAILAGVALFSVGAVLGGRSCSVGAEHSNEDENESECDLGIVLGFVRAILVAAGFMASMSLNSDCCLARLDQADR